MLVQSKEFTFQPFENSEAIVFTGEARETHSKLTWKWIGRQDHDASIFDEVQLEPGSDITLEMVKDAPFPPVEIVYHLRPSLHATKCSGNRNSHLGDILGERKHK